MRGRYCTNRVASVQSHVWTGDHAAISEETAHVIMPMDLAEHKNLIRRWIAFSNTGFAGKFDDFIAPTYVGHLDATTMDRVELERLERQFVEAFPDAHHTIDDLIAEGDRVVLRTTARATHRGRFEGMDPTGRSVEFTGLVVYRVESGKIAESWGEIDFGRLIRALRSR